MYSLDCFSYDLKLINSRVHRRGLVRKGVRDAATYVPTAAFFVLFLLLFLFCFVCFSTWKGGVQPGGPLRGFLFGGSHGEAVEHHGLLVLENVSGARRDFCFFVFFVSSASITGTAVVPTVVSLFSRYYLRVYSYYVHFFVWAGEFPVGIAAVSFRARMCGSKQWRSPHGGTKSRPNATLCVSVIMTKNLVQYVRP